ncbi:MAG: hypothetical protein KF778_21440 [Rhodocyclaceae bacterium]|nr:hypothetical protein [Rhodocyclaceae bacterium]
MWAVANATTTTITLNRAFGRVGSGRRQAARAGTYLHIDNEDMKVTG